jgi:hypothetical protein
LRHDVGHEKHQVVVRGKIRAVFGGTKVAAVVAGAGVVAGGDAVEVRGEIGVGEERGPGVGADVAGGEIPTGPNGFAEIVAVIKSFDGALNQKVVVIVGVGSCARGIAKLHLVRRANDGVGAGSEEKQADANAARNA